MSTELLHQSKVTPVDSTDFDEKSTAEVEELAKDKDEVPIYGELRTTVQTATENERNVTNSFEGTQVDLQDSPFTISNDLFEGKLHVLLRDLPGNTYDFDGEKGVLWEMQIQGKFKRQISGPIYLAMELPQQEKYKVTAPMKMVIRACLQLMKNMGHKDVHMSFGGNGELPHMGAPAFRSFDRVVVTPPGETPPELGVHLPRREYDVQRRKNFFKINETINLDNTYTFSIKNRRFDPLKWKVIGVPLVRQFTVSRFTEAVRLAVYEVLEEDGKPVSDPQGKVTAMAKKKHTKRNNFLWIHLARARQAGSTGK